MDQHSHAPHDQRPGSQVAQVLAAVRIVRQRQTAGRRKHEQREMIYNTLNGRKNANGSGRIHRLNPRAFEI